MRVLYVFSDIAFWIGYHITGYRRSIVVQNLSRSFPDKKYAEISNVGRDFTHHFFNLFAEWVKLVSISRKRLAQRVRFVNLELLSSYNQRGQSVIIAMGHYGNWEYLNLLPEYVDQPVYAVYKKLTSNVINCLGAMLRKRFGINLLESHESSKFVLKNRSIPSIYVFIADQSPSPLVKESFVFMNQPTTAFAGVERLAKATGAAVVYAEIMPTQRGCYIISFSTIPTSNITADFLSALEISIRKSPQYWLWSHKRWKHVVPTLQ